MGVSLYDKETGEAVFDVNFWHWRPIVEAVRSLKVLPDARVDALHEPLADGLSREEARAVAAALREKLLPTLGGHERLLLDQTRTAERDDGTFYRDAAEAHKNYSTNRDVLEQFTRCCETCGGFRVA